MKEFYAASIEEGVWRYIDLFSQYTDLKKKTNSTEKANQISFCLRQAREYYEAARQGTLLIRPVLLYYGALNLCKALILFKNSQISLQSSLTTHGLRRTRVSSTSSLFSLSCRVESTPKSVFYNLLNIATKDRFNFLTSINGKGARQDYASEYSNQISLAVNKSYRFSDVIVVIPELFELLLDTTHLLPRVVPISKFYFAQRTDKQNQKIACTDAILIIRHGRHPKIKKLVKHFEKKPELRDWRFKEDRWDVFEYVIPSEVNNFSFPDIRETIFREQFGVFVTKRKIKLSEIISHFLLIFILGDAARYIPYVWWRLMDKKINERKIVEAFLDVTQVKFPLLILRELRNEVIYFKQV